MVLFTSITDSSFQIWTCTRDSSPNMEVYTWLTCQIWNCTCDWLSKYGLVHVISVTTMKTILDSHVHCKICISRYMSCLYAIIWIVLHVCFFVNHFMSFYMILKSFSSLLVIYIIYVIYIISSHRRQVSHWGDFYVLSHHFQA